MEKCEILLMKQYINLLELLEDRDEEYASNFDNCDGECVDECEECRYYKSRGMC